MILQHLGKLILKTWGKHPNICPHIYTSLWSVVNSDNVRRTHYRCRICGKEITKEESL